MKSQQDDILSRLDKLESENKVFRISAVLLVLSIVALLLLGASQAARRTVTASEFLLQDDQGHTRARLSVDSKDVALVFLGESGQKQMSLKGSNDQLGRGHAALALGEGAVSARYTLAGTDKEDWATISDGGLFLAGKDTTRIVLSASGPTSPSIEVADSLGFASEIGVTSTTDSPTGKTHKSSAASLVLIGKDQSVLWTAP
ncbi:MAG TPA: hypothetical protein VK812_17475 [Candidatus Binatus sp.]|jgi:hypothetical protein|nr:hypothetical protein [Candidatus Binatus sp.]